MPFNWLRRFLPRADASIRSPQPTPRWWRAWTTAPMVRGETNITASKKRIVELMLDPPNAAPLPETLEAIERADLITVGPGRSTPR